MEWSTEDLRLMEPHERAALMRELIELAEEDPLADPGRRKRRRLFIALTVGSCVWLVPWIVYLAFTLPGHYTAGQWSATWTGFDIALLAALAGSALAILGRRQVAIVGMLITSTLLVCDAWFDVMLSWGSDEFPLSVVTALGCELPLAALCFHAARRLIRLTMHAVWVRSGLTEAEPSLIRIRLFTLIEPRLGRPSGRNADREP
ncbi:hypothetical protein [Actinomadura sp. DC4]|uniref:hypothetical protein n=1 Tax=Actinomadura sp. DC4 TaxID=3055069 RepID=UPI0025B1BCFE|nr:hypothetical protein [Actinomadura sp. DC4]MDN3353066.1 hypothetical protein [Actinomadura sp. DC4]